MFKFYFFVDNPDGTKTFHYVNVSADDLTQALGLFEAAMTGQTYRIYEANHTHTRTRKTT
ncbi:MAG TPA: hypothetical protein VF077_00565 [Nitrospiraceae bacterium]